MESLVLKLILFNDNLHHVILILRHFLCQLQILRFSFPAIFGRLQTLLIRFGRKSHGLDRRIVQIEAETNPMMESQLRLASAVDIHVFFGAHPTFFVVQHGFDHAITYSLKQGGVASKTKHAIKIMGPSHLGDNVLGVF